MRLNSFRLLISLGVFLLIYAVTLNTPLHSDDYEYAMKGLSLSSHYNHYMTWSGRIIADYVSAILLSINYHFLRAFLNALALYTLLYLISELPRFISKTSSSLYALPLIFMTYWISNSSLGQTTFWIVGSANYLWTNLFVVAFLYFFSRGVSSGRENITLFSILALLAGCTNENTGYIPAIIIFFYSAYLFYSKLPFTKFIIPFLASCIGYFILILAPGNGVRGQYFNWWFEKPILERLAIHFLHRIPEILSMFWPAIFILLIMLGATALSRNEIYKKSLFFACISLVFAAISCFIMAAAPTYPPRSGNGTLIFILLALSFTMSGFRINNRIYKTAILTLTSPFIILFMFSYMLVFISYSNAFSQNEIRMSVIEEMKKEGKKYFSIPDFYFEELVRDGDKFDTYHDPRTYGRFFGALGITKDEATFDYSGLIKSKSINFALHLYPSNANISKLIISKKGMLIIQTNKDITSSLFKNGQRINVTIKYKDGKDKKYDFWPKSMKIGKYYYSEVNIDPNDIIKIGIGFFDRKDSVKWIEL